MLIVKLLGLLGAAFLGTLVFSVVLTGVGIFHVFAWALLLPCWILLCCGTLLFCIGPVRRLFVTRPLLKIARKILPPMSSTEREALEAGGIWWEAELFCGRPNWKKLHAIPKLMLSVEETAFIENQVKTLCGMLDDWKIVYEESDLSEEVWAYIKKEGFFALNIKKEYGGLGFSALAQSTIVAMISTRSVSAAVTVMVPNSLGPAELLMHYGTEEQRQHYLPRLATGEEVPCFALTSSYAGSDAANMQDYGIICKGQFEGKEVLGMRVTWSKRYITLAPVATLLGLAINLFDPDHLLSNKEALGITVCLVPTDYPGVEIGRRHFPVFHAFQNGSTQGHDVFMPLEFIIGGEKNIGKGWRMLMDCLSVGRAISLPALSAGAVQFCYRMTGAYAKLREQFGLSIGKFEGISEAMSEIAGLNYLSEATRVMTAGAVDLGVKPSVCSAIAKYHLTEIGRVVMNHAMDIHAGRGIQAGPRNYLLNGFMSVPISITVEGANILTRNLIIFGQGAIRCHPYVYDEMQAIYLKDQKKALKVFDALILKHMNFTLSNIARGFLYGLGWTAFVKAPVKGPTAVYYKKLTRMSNALALAADFSMASLGGELKRMESLSARLGDVLSYLYLSSCTLKYYQDNGAQPDDLPHVEWVLQYSLCRAQEALMQFYRNFPKRFLGRTMKFICFPFGRYVSMPTDKLKHQLAHFMMTPSAFRERVTTAIFVSTDPQNSVGRMEQAFIMMHQMEPILKKLNVAEKNGSVPRHPLIKDRVKNALTAGVINEDEAKQLYQFEQIQLDAMLVDEFPPEYLKRKQ